MNFKKLKHSNEPGASTSHMQSSTMSQKTAKNSHQRNNRMTTQTMSYNNSVERYRPSSCQNEESKDVIVNTIVDNKVKDKKKKRCFSLCGCFL